MKNEGVNITDLPNPLKLDEAALISVANSVTKRDKITAMHIIRNSSANHPGLAVSKEYVDNLALLLKEGQ